MLRLIQIELFKIFKRPRTYIGFAAIMIIVLAVQFAIMVEGQNVLEFAMDHLKENFTLEGNLINSYLVSHIILNTLWIHVPFLVALVTGDLLAGEANSGTFRLLLSRPVGRTQLVTAKFIAGLIYTFLLVVFLMFMSLVVGRLILGTGDLLVIREKINIFGSDDVLWRFFLAYGHGVVIMSVVAALSLLLSALADNGIGPIIGTVAIIIGLGVIMTVAGNLIGPLNPYIFTYHMSQWQLFFQYEPDWMNIRQSFFVLLSYLLVFYIATILVFRRKDILS